MKVYVTKNIPIQLKESNQNVERKRERDSLCYLEVRNLVSELYKELRFDEWSEFYKDAATKAVANILLLQKKEVPEEDQSYKGAVEYLNRVIEEAVEQLPDNVTNNPHVNFMVSKLLIPLIDSHFDERDKELQKILYNDICDFYLLTLAFPNANTKTMIKTLEEELNYDIEQYEKRKKRV